MILQENSHIAVADAYADYQAGLLTIGNSLFSRKIELCKGFPWTISLQYKNRELVQPTKAGSDFSVIGLTRPGKENANWKVVSLEASELQETIFDSSRLTVTIRFMDEWSGAQYGRTFFLYPGKPFMGIQGEVISPTQPLLYWNYRELRTEGNATRNDPGNLESRLDSLTPMPEIHGSYSIEFCGRSDYTSIPLKRHQIEGIDRCRGNLLFCEDEKGRGFGWLQEAPPSEERRDMEPYDFVLRDGEWATCGWGFSPAEFQRNSKYTSYRHALFFYENALEQQLHVKEYIRSRFPQDPRLIASLVNPWGCGRFPEYVCPQFLNEEIAAAAECGADVYQVDDSWQQGSGLGEILNGRNIDLNFWKISTTRMNGSFDSQVDAAKAAHIELALWMAPSTNTELEDWNEFADLMLDFHRRYSINFFKLDGLILRTYRSEKNMEAMLRKVREKSQGKIYCNLDTTNGQRGGFLLFQEYGNIFLENRYLWFPRCAYQPEQTLHSLWSLAQYLRPERLQIEVPATEDLIDGTYEEGHLPMRYPFEYWCAIALFASPLIWTAPSKIKKETRAIYKKFMELHRSIRQNLFKGNIYPIGKEPNGQSICGLYGDSGYLIAFRELNAVESQAELLGHFPNHSWKKAELLAGCGSLKLSGKGFQVSIPHAADFALFMLQ